MGPSTQGTRVCVCASVMSDSFQLHGLWPTRLLCPWDFSRQEYWSGLLVPPPGLLPNQRSNPDLLHVLHRQADSSLPLVPPGNTWGLSDCGFTSPPHPLTPTCLHIPLGETWMEPHVHNFPNSYTRGEIDQYYMRSLAVESTLRV